MRDRLVELIKNYPCMSTAKDCFMESIAEDLADYILADGWMRPPCKVGDKVWVLKRRYSSFFKTFKWDVCEGKISMIRQKADKSWEFSITENYSVPDYTVDDIGKKVFFTREEAEAKLKEGGEE